MHTESALRQQKDNGKEWGYRMQERELAHREQSTTLLTTAQTTLIVILSEEFKQLESLNTTPFHSKNIQSTYKVFF